MAWYTASVNSATRKSNVFRIDTETPTGRAMAIYEMAGRGNC